MAIAVAALVVTLTALAAEARAAGVVEAKKLFNQRCTACHTFGKGVKVGPDLKGVTERRRRDWLISFIRSSRSLIASGDPVAVALFQEFKKQEMPDWTDLSEAEIGALLDWLAANGPEQKTPDERSAELATPAEIQLGRDLFHGEIPLASGGMACGGCHGVRDGGEAVGGSFAPDLTNVYAQYRDRALTLFIRQPCFKRLPESEASSYLLPAEIFALKAYLLETAVGDGAGRDAAAGAESATKLAGWTPPPLGSHLRPPMRTQRGPSTRTQFLFLVFPYAAAGLLVVGLAIRLAMARRRSDTLRAEARAAWARVSGSLAWRVGITATAAAHLAGLLVPRGVVDWGGPPLRLYLVEAASLFFGILMLVGWARLMWRHLARSADSRSGRAVELADCVFFSFFFVAIASGLATAVLHRWASSWAAGTVGPYLATLVQGRPATEFIASMPFLIKLHVLSLFALIAALPFTSAALIPVAAMDWALVLATRPVATGARLVRAALTKLSPARWIWPEEDLVEVRSESDSDSPRAST